MTDATRQSFQKLVDIIQQFADAQRYKVHVVACSCREQEEVELEREERMVMTKFWLVLDAFAIPGGYIRQDVGQAGQCCDKEIHAMVKVAQ